MQKSDNLRCYGTPPYTAAVLHGGPGVSGEMAPVAREISKKYGVLEPLLTAYTIGEQLKELDNIFRENVVNPITIIGWSWGAMLGFIFAARYPSIVKKLVLVSSGVFDEKYSLQISEKRLSYLKEEDKILYDKLSNQLNDTGIKEKNQIFKEFGDLISKVDSYDLLPHDQEIIDCQYNLYQSIWNEAKELRSHGKLLELGKSILCPVVAIQGDYDPRPMEGIQTPLLPILKDFHCILLEKCGHHPWLEKHARKAFYNLIEHELAT
jgi:pimeloyl-ACP methyl ester carboxylesterase